MKCQYSPTQKRYSTLTRNYHYTDLYRHPSPQARRKPLYPLASLFQRLVGRCIRDAEVRAEAERSPVHGRHAFVFQQRDDEIFVRIQHLASFGLLAHQGGDGGVDVEGAFGLGADEAGGLVEHRDDEVAPGLEGLAEFRNAILRAVEGFNGCPLRDG